jgi:hypothetical protein
MPSWSRLLDSATSTGEVVSIVRDYLALWTPEEIGLLPGPCRPPHLRDASDVEELHRCVVEAFRNSRVTGEALALLQKLTAFVTQATARLAQLHDGELGGHDASRPAKKMAGGRDR